MPEYSDNPKPSVSWRAPQQRVRTLLDLQEQGVPMPLRRVGRFCGIWGVFLRRVSVLLQHEGPTFRDRTLRRRPVPAWDL